MSSGKNVNLDAMIPREDLNIVEDSTAATSNLISVGIRDLSSGSLTKSHFKKPDFQRETNHWSPEQVCSLIESFMDGDLIPAIILWQSEGSPSIFVIDGGHRLSALRAWIEDDYGNGLVSKKFFGDEITADQISAHKKTKRLIDERIGSFDHWVKLNEAYAQSPTTTKLSDLEKRRLQRFSTGIIPVQWVPGDADKAENSFFKINSQGTPLDDTEELLIKNRKKPTAIAARAIIRAGMGNKYWSDFPEEKRLQIEQKAKKIHSLLFEPEQETQIKTLDLPLGGTAGVRTALSLLISYILLTNRDNQRTFKKIDDEIEEKKDTENVINFGSRTVGTLNKTLSLTERLTGNENGSLGLHPALYFYTKNGKFSSSNFMGIAMLFAEKLADNNKDFFKIFTNVREKFELFLNENSGLLGTISNNVRSQKRYETMATIFEFVISQLSKGLPVINDDVIQKANLKVSIMVPKFDAYEKKFTTETKNSVLIKASLKSALKCPICKGLLNPRSSVSFDHILRIRDGGTNEEDNCQLVHPYCNQSIKN